MIRLALVLAVAGCLLVPQAAGAQTSEQPRPFGQSYPQWAAAWWTWALSQPTDTNPVLDQTGAFCGEGQQGKVWFLAGSFGTDPLTRTCTAPAGKAFFVPATNLVYCAFPEDPPETKTEEYIREQVAGVEGGAHDLRVAVDGFVVPVRYVESRIFSVVLPEGNIFGQDAGFVVDPCVDAGYYAFLPPLEVGEHTIRVQGANDGFAVDVTYLLRAEPPTARM